MKKTSEYDLIIIGGGFYGCELACSYKEKYKNILIVEREKDLLQHASYANQARIHNGYHYPRNVLTASRSHVNFKRFIKDYSPAIDDSFIKLYAIANQNSKVTSAQFFSFFKKIGSPIKEAAKKYTDLFDMNRVENVFEVQEYAFDAVKLKELCRKKLIKNKIKILFKSEADSVFREDNGKLIVKLSNGQELSASEVINATYSRINFFLKNSKLPLLPFKYEVTEMALIKVPKVLKNIGITVMDGPFFSTMPFPPKNLHTLSHVHYTPIYSWKDTSKPKDPFEILKKYSKKSRYIFMMKDASRYVPVLSESKYKESIFEVKTTLLTNEKNDGRPILYRNNYGMKNFSLVMGGKIDNMYDIISQIQKKDRN